MDSVVTADDRDDEDAMRAWWRLSLDFWNGHFNGQILEIPGPVAGSDAEAERTRIREMFEEFHSGLRRYVVLDGNNPSGPTVPITDFDPNRPVVTVVREGENGGHVEIVGKINPVTVVGPGAAAPGPPLDEVQKMKADLDYKAIIAADAFCINRTVGEGHLYTEAEDGFRCYFCGKPKPAPRFKKALVVATQIEAKRIQAIMGDDWMVLAVGQALLGYHFSHILISESAMNPARSGVPAPNRREWIDNLLCKLVDKNTRAANVAFF